MTGISFLARVFRRSLTARWVFALCLVAGGGIGALLLVTNLEMSRQLAKEGEAIERLTKEKTAQRITSEINLVQYRIATHFEDLQNRIAAIAALPSSLKAVRARNDVEISQLIGAALLQRGFDGGVILDQNLTVIGAERPGLELLSAHSVLAGHELRETFERLLRDNDPNRPTIYKFTGPFDLALSAILLAPAGEPYGLMIAQPVFDEFGDAIALIVGYRILKLIEPMLTDFAARVPSSLALRVDNRPISIAGQVSRHFVLEPPEAYGLQRNIADAQIGLCAVTFPRLSVCIMHSEASVAEMQQEIMLIGQTEMGRTRRALIGLGAAIMMALTGLIYVLSRKLSGPLKDLSVAVGHISRGEWRVEVNHSQREDEIGLIARAINDMQASLVERDRMRQEMVRIDAINQRRLVLDNAVSRFEDGMAVVMKNISTCVIALADTNEALDRAAREADIQADAIRDASEMTATRTSAVSSATMQLDRSIQEIGEKIRNASAVVHKSEGRAVEAENELGELTHTARNVETAINVMQELIADIGHLALSASVEAARSGGEGTKFSDVAREVGEFSSKSGEVIQTVMQQLQHMETVAASASHAIGDVKGVLGNAIRETAEISVAVEEQGAASREIADGLNAASGALASLVEAVERLRSSMGEAQDASGEFVVTARRMADDARAIDTSMRSFVNEVAA